MGKKLLLVALGALAAAAVVSARRRVVRIGDPLGNGGTSIDNERLRQLVGERLRHAAGQL
jgi:hypothetical protein